ncbi:MAG: hypothetical protein IJN66_06075 [Muribaculaceae bacterium]|nr:hypothetical protein [Muribaculaceae bacterium]
MINISSEIYKWIEEHQDEDVSKLRLRYHKQMTEELDFAILQIECRRKASKKLSETLQNKQFVFPTTLSAEQCTSDLLSAFHATLIDDGIYMIDLTCGLGIDVYHFAQKAKSITAVERNPEIAQAVKYNAGILGFRNINVQNTDCCEFIKNVESHFDVAFIDPARRGNSGKRLYALSDCEPDVIAILDDIKKKCDKLIIKVSPMLDISQIIRELPEITEIYAIGTTQECKEIVAVVDFKVKVEKVNVNSVTLSKEETIKFSFELNEEQNSSPIYVLPQEQGYLYEPYPAVMKVAPYKLLSSKYNVAKLHSNTHLYTSQDQISDFPGEIFKIEEIIPFSSKEIKKFSTQYSKINVATRNFIMSADDLRQKLKVKDGGEKRVFGCTISDGSRQLIIVSKV